MMETKRFIFILGLLFAPLSLHAEDVHPGKVVFDVWCEHCHGDDHAWSGGGTQALQAKYKGVIPAKLEDRTDMTPEFVTFYVRDGITGMPNFRYTEITKKQMEDLADYLAGPK